MKEIRLHGRGGQGAATAGEVLAYAAFYEGKYAQSFPYFGAERRGAPVVAYTRIDNMPILIRTSIYNPHCVIVLDNKLIKTVNVLEGLLNGGTLVINSADLTFRNYVECKAVIAVVDATRIALDTIGEPITNMAMLGAFSIATKWVKIESIYKAIEKKFHDRVAERNIEAAKMAYQNTQLLS